MLALCMLTGCQRPTPSLIAPPIPEVIVTQPSIQNLTNPLEFNGNAAAVETVEIKLHAEVTTSLTVSVEATEAPAT